MNELDFQVLITTTIVSDTLARNVAVTSHTASFHTAQQAIYAAQKINSKSNVFVPGGAKGYYDAVCLFDTKPYSAQPQ